MKRHQSHDPKGQFNHDPEGQFNHDPKGQFNHDPKGRFNHDPKGQFNHNPKGHFNHNFHLESSNRSELLLSLRHLQYLPYELFLLCLFSPNQFVSALLLDLESIIFY